MRKEERDDKNQTKVKVKFHSTLVKANAAVKQPEKTEKLVEQGTSDGRCDSRERENQAAHATVRDLRGL